MATRVKLLFLFVNFVVLFNFVRNSELTNMIDENILTEKAYVFWPNATIPFFIDDEHFDTEQQLSILTALSLFAFKTCLKFAPVMARPEANEHVLVLENPSGVRKCTISTDAHSVDEPHKVILGYDCLKSPNIDMMIMKALGFPFEHNRAIRDLYIEVQFENVEPGNLDLFNRDLRLPMELRAIPYDTNSVMHFGEREFSSNGHRTIIFKNRNLRQERFGLSPVDLRKIDVVYGPECLKRDRQEKIELCQNYPGVARRKREVSSQSLRVNPDITPPPVDPDSAKGEAYANKIIKELDIEKEVQDLVDQVHKVNTIALAHAKERLCSNDTKAALRSIASGDEPKPKLLDIIGEITSNAKDVVARATKNLTEFCSEDANIYAVQRGSCPFFDKNRCEKSYHSTKSGRVKYSTQHRPLIRQSTRPQHTGKRNIFVNWLRSGNNTNTTSEDTGTSPATSPARRKRNAPIEMRNTNLSAHKHVSAPSDLRMGTKLIPHPKNIYMPNYRASNDSNDNARRKREAPGFIESKSLVYSPKKKDAQRRFESQRFRSKKEMVAKGEYERGKKEREWDNSGISAERSHYRNEKELLLDRQSERHGLKVRQKQRSRGQLNAHGGRLRVDEEDSPEPAEAPLKKTRSRFRPVSNPKSDYEAKESRAKKVDDKYPMDQGPGMGSRISQEEEQDERPPAHEKEQTQEEPAMPEKEPPAVKHNTEGHGKSRWKPQDMETMTEVVETRIVEKISIPSNQAVKFKSQNERGDSMSVLPRVVELNKKNREFYNERKWPDGVVRYLLRDPDGEADLADVRQRLDEVNEILKRRTCARIEEIGEEDADSYEDYLVLDNSPDYVTGRVGGKQNFGVVELLKGGQHRQHGAMMVMAMLGFYFEISRHDRDKHIRVHMRHVRPDKLHHFEKIREDATFPLPYDYKSATHPAWQFWRQIGKTGISTVATFKETDPDGTIMKSLGQNPQLLSELDIVKINSVYGIECFMKGPPKRKKKQMEETRDEEPRNEDPYEEYKGNKQRKKRRRPVVTEDYRESNYGKRQKERSREDKEGLDDGFSSPKRKKKVRQDHKDYSGDTRNIRQDDKEDYREDINVLREKKYEDDKDYKEENNAKLKVKHDDYKEDVNTKEKVRHNRDNDREEEINNAKQRKKRPTMTRDDENREDGREENVPKERAEY